MMRTFITHGGEGRAPDSPPELTACESFPLCRTIETQIFYARTQSWKATRQTVLEGLYFSTRAGTGMCARK